MITKIYRTDEFKKKYSKLDEGEKNIIKKIIKSIKKNPNNGKPLSFKWFREKKYKGKRIYYILYINLLNKVLIISYSNKKLQNNTINKIKENKLYYFNYLKNKK